MKTKTVLTTGLLVAFSLALMPAPAQADADLSIQYCLGQPGLCNYVKTCNPPVSGGGGVIGDTLTYTGDVGAIGCSAAKQEAALALAGSAAACDTTLDYLMGSDCSLTCTCDPQPIGPIRPIEMPAISSNMAAGSSAIAPLACHFGIRAPAGGIVGETVQYGNDMGNIMCNTALAAGYIAAGAAIAICNETGDYAAGNPYWCTIYVVT